MSKHRPIIDRLLNGGEYDADKIDDEIDAWHESDSELALHEWLGFTPEEYALYVEKPQFLRSILAARHYQVPIKQFLSMSKSTALLAARGASPEEVSELVGWLKRTGRL